MSRSYRSGAEEGNKSTPFPNAERHGNVTLAENLQVLPISARIAAIENALPRTFHGDPADRIIAGTAIAHQLTLLTPDWRIAFHRVCPTIRYKWPKRRKRR